MTTAVAIVTSGHGAAADRTVPTTQNVRSARLDRYGAGA